MNRRLSTLLRLAPACLLMLSASLITVSGTASATSDPCPSDAVNGVIAGGFEDPVGVPRLAPGQVDLHAYAGASNASVQRVVGPASSGFGSAVAVGFLDDDHCADLAVGESAAAGGGAVDLIPGTATGFALTGARLVSAQTSADRFGSAVALGSRYPGSAGVGQPFVTDLWVGAPGRTVDGHAGAGAVDHYVIPEAGSPTLLETITADTPGLGGSFAQAGAAFGSVLSATSAGLLVGVPGESDLGRAGAGAAYWFGVDDSTGHLAVAQRFDQSSAGVSGTPEAGDHFGAAVSVSGNATGSVVHQWALVGVPGEGLGGGNTLPGAGLVQSFILQGGQLSPWTVFSQETNGIPGAAEAGDHFGAAVVAGSGATCLDGWMVGSPGEDIGSIADAGSVTLVFPPPVQCRPAIAMYQGKGGLGGAAEAGDQLGATLSVLSHTQDPNQPTVHTSGTYLIGVPGEDVGAVKDAGLVIERNYTLDGPLVVATRSYTYSGGATAGLDFGAVLPGVDTEPKF